MKHFILSMLLLLGLSQASTAQAPASLGTPAQELFARGLDAYRGGQFGEAAAHWQACFAESLGAADRGRVAYNIGNAMHRQGASLQAVGWYTLALRDTPRDREAWENLEFVRAQAGLEPADGGDLSATFKHLLASFLPAESRSLLGLGLGLVLLALLGEAFRGGRFWTRSIWIALLLCAVLALPWLRLQNSIDGDPVLIVGQPSVALRNEPRLGLPTTGKLMAGSEVMRIDALPGWVRVQAAAGKRGWIQETAIFELKL